MNKQPGKMTVWTEEMDGQLRALLKHHTHNEIAFIMDLTWQRVANRRKALGLSRSRRHLTRQPEGEAWIACARATAKRSGVAVSEILVGERRPPVVRARWEAFKMLLDGNPAVSIAGLARVSGFDHTTILYGLARLRGESSAGLRYGSVARSAGRVPPSEHARPTAMGAR